MIVQWHKNKGGDTISVTDERIVFGSQRYMVFTTKEAQELADKINQMLLDIELESK